MASLGRRLALELDSPYKAFVRSFVRSLVRSFVRSLDRSIVRDSPYKAHRPASGRPRAPSFRWLAGRPQAVAFDVPEAVDELAAAGGVGAPFITPLLVWSLW